MKYLYLLRHAKSSWHDLDLDDFDRPLNKRGKRDVPVMGHRLSEKNIIPDLITSSPARRATETAEEIARSLKYPRYLINFDERIYEAGITRLMKVIRATDPKTETLLLIGHNPGLTDLANALADDPIGNLPTCSVYGIELPIMVWEDIDFNRGHCILYEYPKQISSRQNRF